MREDGEDLKVEAALGKIVYSITRKELINDGYLNNAIVEYYEIPKLQNEYFIDYHDAYEQYIVNNDYRNNKICELAIKEFKKNKKVLILVTQIAHYDKIKELLLLYDNDLIAMNGQQSKKERKILMEDALKRNKCIVLATTIFDMGVDIPDLDVIVLGNSGKSFIRITQRIGRILRNKPGKEIGKIIDFKDNCKWLFSHYKRRRKILEEDFEVIEK
jgi:superfamily II DNA or RNA helicase